MTTLALRREAAWPAAVIALAGAWCALLLLFRDDVAAVAGLWWTSTTYGHCLFILPVVAWLVWNRRVELAQLTPVGWAPGLMVVAAGAVAWLLGDAGAVALVRQWALVTMLEGAVLATLGPNVARGLLFPMAYAWFAVPFGAELEPPLQQVTVAMVMPMLHAAGVAASVDGVLIHAGPYWFEVAEACSGAKFVLAMLAYGVLVAHLCFRGWRRRAIFMAVALVVPVVANAVRAFATIYAAQGAGVAAATGMDHIVYGWIFFAAVMAALMAAAWRWFDRAPDAAAFDPATLQARPRWVLAPLAAAVLAVAGAALAPAWSAAVAARARAMPQAMALPEVAGWQRVPVAVRGAWSPWHPGADHHLFGRYADRQGDAVDMALVAYAGQGEGRKLAAFGTGALREADRWIRVADLPDVDGGRAIRIVAQEKDGTTVERVVVTWYRVGDTLTGDDATVKYATMKDRLAGGTQTAVALHLSAVVTPGHDAAAAIRRFRAGLGPLDRAIDGIVARTY